MKKILFVLWIALFATNGCGGGGGENGANSTPSNSPSTSEPNVFNPLDYEGFYTFISSDCPSTFNFGDTEITYLYSAVLEGSTFYYYITSGGVYVWTDSNGGEVAFCIQGISNGRCKYNQACIGNNLSSETTWKLTCDDSYGDICHSTYERK